MKEIIINSHNEGTKLLRMLNKLLPAAKMNFLYKMLRKKNITLNGKKASGSEELKDGDKINIFFSDETYEKFSGAYERKDNTENLTEMTMEGSVYRKKTDNLRLAEKQIIYEDDDIILCNKPAGILSQKADRKDVSMVELITDHLEKNGEYDPGDAMTFRPAVTNRLDRNTSGIIAAGKTVKGLKFLSEGFKDRKFEKFYLCTVKGVPDDTLMLNGLWYRASHGNKVRIKLVGSGKKSDTGKKDCNKDDEQTLSSSDTGFPEEYFIKGNVPVQTLVHPIRSNGRATVCAVRLMTGKTHQIRAHLAEAGFPLLGDHKYGDRAFNDYYKDLYGVEYQLLHAFMLFIPGKGVFFAEIPEQTENLMKGEGLWVHGIQEVFGDLLSKI